MPSAPRRWCAYCRGPHDGRCPVLQRQRERDCDASRPTPNSREYDSVWRRCRDGFLRANPLCGDCQRNGRLRAADEVHRAVKIRDDPSRRLDWSNLFALRKSCHSAPTTRGE